MSDRRTHTYFISDAHLGARYMDDPRRHERILVDMLDRMSRNAKAVYMLGDMLDFWFEYRHVVPKGYVRFFGKLAQMVDQGIDVYWFKGNHDMWTDSYLTDEIGVTIVDENMETVIDGKHFFLSHGDGLGKLPKPYSILRSIFRNRTCQAMGRALHPSWLLPFAHRWSNHSRHKRGGGIATYKGDDNEQQMQFAIAYARQHPETDYFINGHRHISADRPVPGSHARFVCLGDCFRQFTYAVFDGSELKLEQYESEEFDVNIF